MSLRRKRMLWGGQWLAQVTVLGSRASTQSQIGLTLESLLNHYSTLSWPWLSPYLICFLLCAVSVVSSYSRWAQASFCLLRLPVPSLLICLQLFVTELLSPPARLVFTRPCGWTRGQPMCIGSQKMQCGEQWKRLWQGWVLFSTYPFLLPPSAVSLSICSCMPFHHPQGSYSGVLSGDIYTSWHLGYRSLIPEVILKNVRKNYHFNYIFGLSELRIIKSTLVFGKRVGG